MNKLILSLLTLSLSCSLAALDEKEVESVKDKSFKEEEKLSLGETANSLETKEIVTEDESKSVQQKGHTIEVMENETGFIVNVPMPGIDVTTIDDNILKNFGGQERVYVVFGRRLDEIEDDLKALEEEKPRCAKCKEILFSIALDDTQDSDEVSCEYDGENFIVRIPKIIEEIKTTSETVKTETVQTEVVETEIVQSSEEE